LHRSRSLTVAVLMEMATMRWFLAVLVILLIALILDSGLLAYSMYVLLALLLLTRFLSRSWIGHLSATRECNKSTAEIGDKVAVTVVVSNSSSLPVPWVLLEDLLPRYALDRRLPRLKVKGKRVQICMVRPKGDVVIKYSLECLNRGYYQIGPLVMENGDLFGLHRRFRVETKPHFLLVYPKIVGLEAFEIASRRPIGDVRMTYRLFEDPTRVAGVRAYEVGDPLNRIHWRATARTGELHSKVHEPSTLTGATILLDFHEAGYPTRGEPVRSELAVTAAVSLANAVYEMGQQIGLVTNGRDAADRLKTDGWELLPKTRQAARESAAMGEQLQGGEGRLDPLIVETRRGVEQLQRIRETLARVEMTDGLTFAQLVFEAVSRLPRDATVVPVLPDVSFETAIALGNLRRRGFAVTVVLVFLDDLGLERCYGRLMAEGIRDVRHLPNEAALPALCRHQVEQSAPYQFVSLDAAKAGQHPDHP
jgi:uncharacterized repeat protein (TIGR01451 family)